MEETTKTDEAASNLRFSQQLRMLRKVRGLSLKEVADRAQLSIGMLSQVERGLSSPSIRSLQKLAGTFGVPMAWFFEEADEDASPERERIVRRSRRRLLRITKDGVVKELLTPDGLQGVELLLVTLEPGGTSGAQPYTHHGKDAGFVLKGVLTLTIDGEDYRLGEGDSFGFPSSTPHRFQNDGKTLAQIVWVNTPKSDYPAD